MYDAKKQDIYLNKYVSFHRTVKKVVSMATIIFSSTGLISWLTTNGNSLFTGIALSLSVISKLIELFQSQIIASDEYLSDVSELRMLCIDYYNHVQSIFIDLRIKKTDQHTAWERYGQHINLKNKIEEKLGNTKIWIFNYINKSSNLETTNYMARYYEQTK